MSAPLLTILTTAGVTVLIRFLPFLIFRSDRPTPPYIRYLGRVLPYAMIGMLVVYCFKSTSFLTWPYGLPEPISGAFVVLAHKWKHNLLLSIGGGTILYMVLIQTVFK